ncbi:hypothetical protein [Streptomyces sp. NK08204]|uniref:hypothetical protein n=1 Tax=Streptomyces sp. NK08204 TaxID=2873260 RepID=UPI001CEDAD69|nr:hypothetical protein [Streptomyces sp. NK08204]
MSRRTRRDPRAGRGRCGARLPSRGTARVQGARPTTPGSVRRNGRGAGGDWLLLPDRTWRRVETIRVPSLFG